MTSNEPFISVLINNYNYARFLGQAVESVLSQTWKSYEIIIVDDGSSDNSAEVIEKLVNKNPSIKTIMKSNGGQASAFNSGFQIANGQIIAFLDSDDWWKPEKLATIIHWHTFLEGNYAMIQHGVDVWKDGKTYPFKPALLSGDLFQHTLKTGENGLFVGSSGLVFPRHIIEQVMPVPEKLWISADAYLTRTSFALGPVYSIPIALGYYRKHQNLVMGNSSHNAGEYHLKMVVPELNAFYGKKNIEFSLPTKHYSRPNYLAITDGNKKKPCRLKSIVKVSLWYKLLKLCRGDNAGLKFCLRPFRWLNLEEICASANGATLYQLCQLAIACDAKRVASVCSKILIKRCPDDINARHDLIRMLAHSVDHACGIREMENIVAENPDDFQRRPYTYGILYLLLGRYLQAMACFNRADKENINYLNSRFALGKCNNALGNYSQALMEYEYIIKYDLKNSTVYLEMIRTLITLEKFEEAQQILELAEMDFGYLLKINTIKRNLKRKRFIYKVRNYCSKLFTLGK